MDEGEISGQADTRARLFWGVIQSLVDAQINERTETPVDVALEYLDSQLDQLQEMEFRARLERLIADMRSCLGLGGGTVTSCLNVTRDLYPNPCCCSACASIALTYSSFLIRY